MLQLANDMGDKKQGRIVDSFCADFRIASKGKTRKKVTKRAVTATNVRTRRHGRKPPAGTARPKRERRGRRKKKANVQLRMTSSEMNTPKRCMKIVPPKHIVVPMIAVDRAAAESGDAVLLAVECISPGLCVGGACLRLSSKKLKPTCVAKSHAIPTPQVTMIDSMIPSCQPIRMTQPVAAPVASKTVTVTDAQRTRLGMVKKRTAAATPSEM